MDGKIIGIAYSNGLVTLVDVESKEEIHSFVVKSDIASICWTQNAVEIDESERSVLEHHKTFLAPLPNINTITTGNKKVHYDSGKFYSKNMLNFLLVACKDAKVHIFIFGVLSCGSIDVAKDLGAMEEDEIELLEVKLSTSFKELYVVYSKNGKVDLLVYENETLLKYQVPLWKLSVKYGMVLNILGYIEDTIQHLTEAWECVLLEMDKKLTKYAKEQPRGSVSADFLELLLFGYPSEALDHFLTQELTEKELKKLGNSIELSYSTIQKLVVKPLHNAIVSLVYHINSINGMQQNSFYYKDILGEVSNDAVINTGAFLIKSYELQQTIDKSMRDYKIFFRWLYIAISRLLDETTVPEDIGTINQQEINYLAEFLYNFEQNREESVDDGGEKEVKFNLERVGQYLADKDLIIPVQDSTSMWQQLLSENECLRSNAAIYPHHKQLSLIQQNNLMRKSIDELFGRLETTVGASFKLKPKSEFNAFETDGENRKVVTSHAIDSETEHVTNMFTVLVSTETLLLLICNENSPMQTFELKFRNSEDCIVPSVGQLSFISAKFYSSKIISVLIKNQVEMRSFTCFVQLSVSRVTENAEAGNFFSIDVYSLLDDTTFKVLDGFVGMTLAVSGSRKVAAILAGNSKVLRLYDMENEEDEIEEDDSNLNETQ